jgi:molybdopterin-guanine dinucleotide biosynthesis protein A
MGRDKAGLIIDGLPLLERTARVAREVTARVLVAGRPSPSGWPLGEVTFLPDETTGLGPLGGIATALSHAQAQGEAAVLALACDMPALTPDALRWLARQWQQACSAEPLPGLVACREGANEPLFCVYTDACLPLLSERATAGQLSLRGLIEAAGFLRAEAPPEIASALANVNTPAEFAAFTGSPV